LLPSSTVDVATVADFTGASDSVLQSRLRELRSDEAATKSSDGDDKGAAEVTHVAASPAVRNEVLRFALPALGSVLADPLMSLVDTAAVGQYSSLHLAALAPNTSIFNLFFQGDPSLPYHVSLVHTSVTAFDIFLKHISSN
jgi:hypothetical protein